MANYRKCLICGEQHNIQSYCNMQGCEYVKCGQCGHIYVDQFASQQQMLGAYTGGGLKSLRRRLLGPFRKLKHVKGFKPFMQRARQIYAFASAGLDAGHKNRFLDIGCNKGFLLTAAIEQGCDVYGVELVKELIRPFINTYPQFREQIYSEKFSVVGNKFADEYFDLITAIDVIEHFEDPISDLQEIYRVLKKGGWFVIQTPDTACAEAKAEVCAWGALKPLEHLHLFDSENLKQLCEKIGFSDYSAHEAFEYADGNFVAIMKK